MSHLACGLKNVLHPFRLLAFPLKRYEQKESVRKVANKSNLENIPFLFSFLPSVSTMCLFYKI